MFLFVFRSVITSNTISKIMDNTTNDTNQNPLESQQMTKEHAINGINHESDDSSVFVQNNEINGFPSASPSKQKVNAAISEVISDRLLPSESELPKKVDTKEVVDNLMTDVMNKVEESATLNGSSVTNSIHHHTVTNGLDTVPASDNIKSNIINNDTDLNNTSQKNMVLSEAKADIVEKTDTVTEAETVAKTQTEIQTVEITDTVKKTDTVAEAETVEKTDTVEKTLTSTNGTILPNNQVDNKSVLPSKTSVEMTLTSETSEKVLQKEPLPTVPSEDKDIIEKPPLDAVVHGITPQPTTMISQLVSSSVEENKTPKVELNVGNINASELSSKTESPIEVQANELTTNKTNETEQDNVKNVENESDIKTSADTSNNTDTDLIKTQDLESNPTAESQSETPTETAAEIKVHEWLDILGNGLLKKKVQYCVFV